MVVLDIDVLSLAIADQRQGLFEVSREERASERADHEKMLHPCYIQIHAECAVCTKLAPQRPSEAA